jgi:hypothetical protein
MKSAANTPRFAPNPSIWSLVKGFLGARVTILVLIGLIGTLLLAASAHAASTEAEPAGETSSSVSVAEPAAEASSPAPAEPAPEASPAPAEATPEAPSPGQPAVEQAPEASSPAPAAPAPEASSPTPVVEPVAEASSPAPVEPAPEVSSPAPTEPAPEASSPVEPVVEQVQEVLSPAEPVVEKVQEVLAPVVEQVKEVSSPATPVIEPTPEASPVETSKEVPEVSAGKPILEHGTESLSSADNPASSVAPEASGAATGPVTTALSFAPVTTILPPIEELPAISTVSSAYAAALARKGVAQRAVAFALELGGLGASPLYTQTVGLEVHSLISVALVEDLAMGKAGRAGVRAGGRSGNSPGGSGPIAPQPGPAPGGAFGGAAGGGSGIALSGFPTYAGHLLLGAPLAMRRLRLSFQPWLTAFFVLIPERPG